tara:strand:- start:247 stop:495 length:249 start_codon:yes stop_codon:yes gene_type:complete
LQIGRRLEEEDPLKITILLKMQLFLVLKKLLDELVEDLRKIIVQTILKKDHLLEALIHRRQKNLDQEITVQDLMINQRIIIY